MSKGSKQRPIKDREKFNKNYDEIFGQKEQEELTASYKLSLANKKERDDKYTTKEIIEAMDRINARH
jgi:hypothetical protein